MIIQSEKFANELQSKNTSIIPMVVFERNNTIVATISTNGTHMSIQGTNRYFEPILNNIPSIRESVDIESRNFKISNISLTINNFEIKGQPRFSDKLNTIINSKCYIYYKPINAQNENDCLKVFEGVVTRMSHTDISVSLSIEDRSQENVHKQIPITRLEATDDILDKYKNKPVPICYGEVKGAKAVITPSDDGTQDYKMLLDREDILIKGYVSDNLYNTPLYTYIEDTKVYLKRSTVHFNYGDNAQYETTLGSSKIVLKRIFDDSTPHSAFAVNEAEIWYKKNPDIAIHDEEELDTGWGIYKDGYFQDNTVGVKKDNTPQEIINLHNILDDNIFSYGNLHTINKPEDECNMLAYWSDDLNRIVTRYFLLRCTFNKLSDDNLFYHNRAIPQIIIKGETLDYFHSSTLTDTPITLGFARALRTDAGNFATNFLFDEGGEDNVFLLWNHNNEDLSTEEHTIDDTSENMEFFSVNIRPSNYNEGTGNSVSVNSKINIFEISQNWHGRLKDIFKNQFYVDVWGRKGEEGVDYKWDYIRKVAYFQAVVWKNHIGYTQIIVNEINYPLIKRFLKTNRDHIIEFWAFGEYRKIKITSNAKTNPFLGTKFQVFDYEDIGENPIDNGVIPLGDMYFCYDYISSPPDIIRDLLLTEIGYNGEVNESELETARAEHKNIHLSVNQADEINSKNLIEKIARESKLYPKFRNDGSFGFNTIKDIYDDTDVDDTIDINDIINYKFNRTKLEDIKTKIKIIYGKNALGEYTKSTEYLQAGDYFAGYDNNYYGLSEDDRTSTLDFTSEYIQDETSALTFQKYLMAWYANQHNIIDLEMPLKYLKYEIGDIVKFDELINNIKLYGEDYTINQARNGQYIYKYFMVLETTKNINKMSMKLLQLHRNEQTQGGNVMGSGIGTGKKSGMLIEQELDELFLDNPDLKKPYEETI